MSKDDDKQDFEEFQRRMQQVFGGLTPGQFNMDSSWPAGDAGDPGETSDLTEPTGEADDAEDILARIREFSLKPREVRDHLDRFVISQNEAKKVLSVAICDHYNHVRQCVENPELREQEYAKQNVILLGPTGVGKTYLIRCIAKLIGVPFVKADATKFSETGYVGRDVEDLVRDLVRLADNNLELAQYGIIYVDEIDKIANVGSSGTRDVSGRGVQINLLKLMEETDVSLHSQTDLIGQMEAMMNMMHGDGEKKPRTISTGHMLFIVSGAFDKLAERVRNRVQGSQIGFGLNKDHEPGDDNQFLRYVQTKDFVDYGYEPEFIGRLPVRVVCEALKIMDLHQILSQSEGSILRQYKADFHGYDIDLELDNSAVERIAELAHTEKTGARGLLTVLERVFRDYKFELPSTPIKQLAVTSDIVSDPQAGLEELLAGCEDEQRRVLAEEVQKFADRFAADYKLELKFTQDAVTRLIEESLDSGKTIRALCESRFEDYQYGLNLISRSSGRKTFEITEAVVRDPDAALSKWVVESFDKDDADDDKDKQSPADSPDPESGSA